ncbi:MAG: hypothetical protein HETSPECPRED_007947 [Heterodermia speciosa]|uniref:ATP synthase F(0) complex subunit e, mitochondrial n=1 Tax=Heterodermia speciosa TaxID=116794 RepID=A0A8H3I979_9LECA|nr:MAG: hypothetical protein HETSPECPRED_007947 [Heterodermia speciosa]
MASSGANVLRYTALITGVGYGLYRQATITTQERIAQTNREYHAKSDLIEKAKVEWIKKTKPREEIGVISNPDDPKFDLEAFLTTQMGAK